MEMEDHQYATITDLRQLISGAAGPPPPQPPHFSAVPGHGLFPRNHHIHMMISPEMMMVNSGGSELHHFADSGVDEALTNGATTMAVSGSTTNLECDLGGTGRWPRQETLTLLEIRSRLDPKFKEANHKGPLWDEVSRIMCEEHGYQRSGKKCREKFENLYKYYKKTKEGKAGRQDGKNYRFFRQLEALYGESNYNLPLSAAQTHLVPSQLQDHKICDSLSLSNSSEFETCNSSEDNDSSEKRSRKRRSGGRSWKVKIKDFIDTQMRKLMEKQEAWFEKMVASLEQKEQERMVREEQWRRQEAERMDRERKFWAKERAWIENRDATLMEILEKIKGRDHDRDHDDDDDDHDLTKIVTTTSSSPPNERMGAEFQNKNQNENEIMNSNATRKCRSDNQNNWEEPEMTRLIQLRSGLESRLQQIGHNPNGEELLWGEISAKMCCYGYERSATMCKEKWEAINHYLIKKANREECNKKLKEDKSSSRTSSYFHNNDSSLYNHDGSSPSSSNARNVVQDSSFQFLMGDGDPHNLWENYGLKLNNGQNH